MSEPSRLEQILLVEDDDDIREVAELALSSSGGFEVATCGSGAEAHDAAAEFGPDLVLLDVMMPEVDGMTVLDELRDDPETASIPVVFLTARAQPDEVEQYRDRGVADVIVKPFDPVELPDRVRDAWERATEIARDGD